MLSNAMKSSNEVIDTSNLVLDGTNQTDGEIKSDLTTSDSSGVDSDTSMATVDELSEEDSTLEVVEDNSESTQNDSTTNQDNNSDAVISESSEEVVPEVNNEETPAVDNSESLEKKLTRSSWWPNPCCR